MDKSGESSSWPDLHKVCWLSPCSLRSSVWTYLRNPAVFLPLFYIPYILAHDHRRIKACDLFSASVDRISGSCLHMQVFFPNPFSFFIPFGIFFSGNQYLTQYNFFSGFCTEGRVKISETNRLSSFLPIKYFALLLKTLQIIVINNYPVTAKSR